MPDYYNAMIDGIRTQAKKRRDFTDDDLAKYCGLKSGGSIRNKASKGELTRLRFETVATIARLAGYDIEFRRTG